MLYGVSGLSLSSVCNKHPGFHSKVYQFRVRKTSFRLFYSCSKIKVDSMFCRHTHRFKLQLGFKLGSLRCHICGPAIQALLMARILVLLFQDMEFLNRLRTFLVVGFAMMLCQYGLVLLLKGCLILKLKDFLMLIRSAVRLYLQTHDFPSESVFFVTAFVTHFNYQTEHFAEIYKQTHKQKLPLDFSNKQTY